MLRTAAAIALVALLAPSVEAQTLKLCAKKIRATGEIREGSPVRLRSECRPSEIEVAPETFVPPQPEPGPLPGSVLCSDHTAQPHPSVVYGSFSSYCPVVDAEQPTRTRAVGGRVECLEFDSEGRQVRAAGWPHADSEGNPDAWVGECRPVSHMTLTPLVPLSVTVTCCEVVPDSE